jgi:hypothetical protein
MRYLFTKRNKFPHIILIPHDPKQWRASAKRKLEEFTWLKENLGQRNVGWTNTTVMLYRGEKFFTEVYSVDILSEISVARQYGFLTKEACMLFFLKWA